MTSLKDIAERCGVSVATVSKALNGRADIAGETRDSIRLAAAEMGYLPNAAAQSLKTKRTWNLGVLFLDNSRTGLAHEYFSLLLNSFKDAAERRGYDITFISRNVGGRKMTFLEHCRYRACDGVMAACVDFADPEVAELVESGIPLVTMDHVFNDHTAVLSDNADGMKVLTSYIAERGHRRIAFVHGEETSVTRARLAGFHTVCAGAGIEVPEEYVVPGLYHDTSSGYDATRRLLSLKIPPTCIIYPDDFTALGGMNALEELSLNAPADVSVAGYDGIPLSQAVKPRLTTMRQNTERMGAEAAGALADAIEHPETAYPRRILVPCELIPGCSVAPPPERAADR